MRRARNFRAANAQMRQLGFAEGRPRPARRLRPERDGDVLAYSRAILQPRYSAAPCPTITR
jgi:oligopeptidase A